MANDVVIYSAVAGDHDYWADMVYSPEVDYIFFTNRRRNHRRGWRNEELPDNGRDPRRQAKQPKCNPHMFPQLREYKYAIWIDGSMQVTNKNFHREILSYMDRGMVCSPHFDGRQCAYSEATIRIPKYAKEPLDEQVAFYRAEGFPEEHGLYECGISARDMTLPIVEEVGKLWYQQNMDWSYQDQVSFPYVLWKTGFQPDVLPQTFRNMKWVHVNAHKTDA